MLKRLTCCLSLLLLLSATAAAQQGRGPSTAEERAKAVRLARELENDPLGESAGPSRAWLIEFVKTVPDIDVVICSSLLAELFKTKESYAVELSIQPVFSETAFVIEHPESAKDLTAVLVAGVKGTLRAYESILKTEPKARHGFLDGLIEKRDKDQLESWVAETAKVACTAERKVIR
jgi:hypothetical protein